MFTKIPMDCSSVRHREFTGPTPHSVAILGRPVSKIPVEHLILERRRIEDLREKSIADCEYNKQCDLKSKWVVDTDRAIMRSNITREVNNHIQAVDMTLQRRRQKLRELLLTEEENYLKEMEDSEETIEDRQEQMKKRAKFLKEKREVERKAYVEEKLNEKFREECEELRCEFSKRTRDEIFKDRQMQIQMKKEGKQREEEIERFYAQLWKVDTEAKEIREELETKDRLQRDRECLEVLNQQKQALKQQREEEEVIKKMESKWLKEEASLRASEEEQLLREKKQKQRNARRELDISMKLKQRKQARDLQEELAMDMKILDKILSDTEHETTEERNRKIQLRDEMQRFMHYVSQTRAEDKEEEQRLEELINEEVQEAWRKKNARIKLEKQARKTILEDVLKTREQQIKERELITMEEKDTALKERFDLHQQMELYRQEEQQKINATRQENIKYRKHLAQQIQYQNTLKKNEVETARMELDRLNDAELSYQRNLQYNLHKPSKKLHPLRISACM